MALTDVQRLYLRTLWEETGGEKDTIHEFWQEVRRRGLRISYPKVAFSGRTEPISAAAKRRLEELWGTTSRRPTTCWRAPRPPRSR